MAKVTRQAEIIGNADYLAHRYDEVADGFRFIDVPREVHRNCTFITDKHLPNVDQYEFIDRANVGQAAIKTAPVHFIFHSAYCCSTMLARAFDMPGIAMGLKEPVVLNDMIGWRRRGADPRKLAAVLDQSLKLLARPMGDDQAIIIKPSNICTPLAIPALKSRPDSKALLLYAPLQSYLKSIAKKEMWGRIWVRDVLIGTLKDGYAIGGFSQEELLQLTDLQVAAIGWLSQHAAFAKIIALIGSDRVKTLDSDSLLVHRRETLEALSLLFNLDMDAETVGQCLDGPAFNSHSKLDQAVSGEIFDADARRREQDRMEELYGAEIEMVSNWAEAVAKSQGIEMEIGSKLI
ncbi:hypothetical protein [Parasphingorhabdus halotolerans]|uniref:Sulfotransferase family protein n=1 Tax=Parasphingorhabdus halotolerans TaxID=2725558 RepID=A0A6H2DLN4_9SPHN|nr:hypothetical protein [Parasphingorhabdus halotolerans]QJB69108.1 hypothetical protein HF685_07270 [Parasphingorhabdus halotolerans]